MPRKKSETVEKKTTTKRGRGRPRVEINKQQFVRLVGIGCTAKEICWFFAKEDGKPLDTDTISNWCKREFGCTFEEYKKDNGGVFRNYQLRENQLKLSEKNAAMAIFLGKNYLGQKDTIETVDNTPVEKLDEILTGLRDRAKAQQSRKAKQGEVDLNE